MTKKEQCKQLMLKFFGPVSAIMVDHMDEENCIEKCKVKVSGLLGEDKAKEFDKIE